MTRTVLIALALVGAQASAQAPHPCADDALNRAESLMQLHWGAPDMLRIDLDDTVREISPIASLQGKGKLDVLETWGYVYKASYRMRFIYARIGGSCLLMGQEIIDSSDPY